MALIENTLFETKDKVNNSLKIIREFEPPEGYSLEFSGGKDSQVLYYLAIISEVKFDAHFRLTTVDPPEVVKFIREYYPNVQIHRPEYSMWDLIGEMKKSLPTRTSRFCCEYLKEWGGKNRILLTGIRWEESVKRKNRKIVEQCARKSQNKIFVNPIINWTEGDVWTLLKRHVPYHCSLYDEGYKRIGCIMCPMGGTKGMLRDAKRYPKYYDNYIRAIKKLLDYRKKTKYRNLTFNSPEEMMHWWIYGKEHKGNPDQTVIFE